jgi:hypothetical protein
LGYAVDVFIAKFSGWFDELEAATLAMEADLIIQLILFLGRLEPTDG